MNNRDGGWVYAPSVSLSTHTIRLLVNPLTQVTGKIHCPCTIGTIVPRWKSILLLGIAHAVGHATQEVEALEDCRANLDQTVDGFHVVRESVGGLLVGEGDWSLPG